MLPLFPKLDEYPAGFPTLVKPFWEGTGTLSDVICLAPVEPMIALRELTALVGEIPNSKEALKTLLSVRRIFSNAPLYCQAFVEAMNRYEETPLPARAESQVVQLILAVPVEERYALFLAAANLPLESGYELCEKAIEHFPHCTLQQRCLLWDQLPAKEYFKKAEEKLLEQRFEADPETVYLECPCEKLLVRLIKRLYECKEWDKALHYAKERPKALRKVVAAAPPSAALQEALDALPGEEFLRQRLACAKAGFLTSDHQLILLFQMLWKAQKVEAALSIAEGITLSAYTCNLKEVLKAALAAKKTALTLSIIEKNPRFKIPVECHPALVKILLDGTHPHLAKRLQQLSKEGFPNLVKVYQEKFPRDPFWLIESSKYRLLSSEEIASLPRKGIEGVAAVYKALSNAGSKLAYAQHVIYECPLFVIGILEHDPLVPITNPLLSAAIGTEYAERVWKVQRSRQIILPNEGDLFLYASFVNYMNHEEIGKLLQNTGMLRIAAKHINSPFVAANVWNHLASDELKTFWLQTMVSKNPALALAISAYKVTATGLKKFAKENSYFRILALGSFFHNHSADKFPLVVLKEYMTHIHEDALQKVLASISFERIVASECVALLDPFAALHPKFLLSLNGYMALANRGMEEGIELLLLIITRIANQKAEEAFEALETLVTHPIILKEIELKEIIYGILSILMRKNKVRAKKLCERLNNG